MLFVACSDAFSSANATTAVAPDHAEQLFGALAARVADPMRDPKYDAARVRIAEAAFIPGRVWNDTSVWTAWTASRRTLAISGRYSGSRYLIDAVRALSPIAQPADSRHVINLTRLSDEDEYAWDTDVTYAIGKLTAVEAGRLVGGLWSVVEGHREADVRAAYSALVPRASAALGQLFRLDSIRGNVFPDRSTLATVAFSVTTERIDARYPAFAAYMRKYASSTVLHARVADGRGLVYLQIDVSGGHVALRSRTLDRALLPLSPSDGDLPLPDSLLVTADFTMKVRHFTLGVRGYRSDLTIIRTPHERAWNFVSRHEPEWVLPPVTERLLRSPLRRPFTGSGASFRVGVRDDSAGGQSVLHRRMHLEVKESLILRFIGRLGAIAVSDYSGDAEREQYAWLTEVLTGLAADIRAADTRK